MFPFWSLEEVVNLNSWNPVCSNFQHQDTQNNNQQNPINDHWSHTFIHKMVIKIPEKLWSVKAWPKNCQLFSLPVATVFGLGGAFSAFCLFLIWTLSLGGEDRLGAFSSLENLTDSMAVFGKCFLVVVGAAVGLAGRGLLPTTEKRLFHT